MAIGESWSFGRNREGNAARLAELAKAHGFTVKAIPPVMLDGAPVSSTRIREAITQRRFDDAARLLGRSYAVAGTVIHGEERGRTIGFPTANLGDVEQLLPPRGVYAAKARVAGNLARYPAVLNLGKRPTFTSNGEVSLEVHLLDFSGRSLRPEALDLRLRVAPRRTGFSRRRRAQGADRGGCQTGPGDALSQHSEHRQVFEAQKLADEFVLRPFLQFDRRTDLLDAALVENDDAVGELERLRPDRG